MSSDTPAAIAAENLLFMRRCDLNGHLNRQLAILKMRASQHDTRAHAITISDTGVSLTPAAAPAR